MNTATPHARARPHDHVVGFYASDAYLVASVADFLDPMVNGDGVALVIATPEHERELRRLLHARGLDTLDPERYVALDAAVTLAAFSTDEGPDAARFRTVVGDVIEHHVAAGRTVMAFGEMVSLLWERGEASQTLYLEGLWNDLGEQLPFELFCAYASSAFEDDLDIEGFEAIVAAHSDVHGPESRGEADDPGQQRRDVAVLQHRLVTKTNESAVLRWKQAELEDALARLAEADRLRRQFVAMVIHDIRSPTTVLSGIVSILQEDWPTLDAADIRASLDTISRSTRRIARLVDDILMTSRLESGGFTYDTERVDLGSIIDEVVKHQRDATGRVIDFGHPPNLPTAFADGGRQEQILANLLSNAAKFSIPGARIRVSIREIDRFLEVAVHDSGPGIPEEDQPALFRPFVRFQRAGGSRDEGTGLGLFITRALVEGQGGTIRVDSAEGTGTTFTYTVPLASR